MPRSRSRSPRGKRFHHSISGITTIDSFRLDRYGNNRYRGGAASNSGGGGGGGGRRRSSRSRSPRDRTYRDRDRDRERDRYPQRSERPAKRYSRSRSRTRSPSPKAFGNKIIDKRNEPAQRIFDRKQTSFFRNIHCSLSSSRLASELQGKTEDEIEMLKTMGFASFDTTKVKTFSMKIIVFQDGFRRVNIRKVPPMHTERVSNRNVVIGKQLSPFYRSFQV